MNENSKLNSRTRLEDLRAWGFQNSYAVCSATVDAGFDLGAGRQAGPFFL